MVFERGSKMAQSRDRDSGARSAGERFADRGGMMSEIVDHLDSAHLAPHFLPPLDALNRASASWISVERHAIEVRRGDRHRRVAHVEFADQADLEFGVAEQLEVRTPCR